MQNAIIQKQSYEFSWNIAALIQSDWGSIPQKCNPSKATGLSFIYLIATKITWNIYNYQS